MSNNEVLAGGPVPSVFVEPITEETVDHSSRPRSRGTLLVAILVLFGALVATTIGLLSLRNHDQAEWDAVRHRLETERGAALEKLGRVETANVAMTADLAAARAKVEKYGVIEYQLNLIREKTDQIIDLRKAKPSYPASSYMKLDAVPDWSAPGEKLLKDFVAKLDAERAKLIAFKEPKPTPPTLPNITPGH